MLKRLVESIAHGLASSRQRCRLEMWGQRMAAHRLRFNGIERDDLALISEVPIASTFLDPTGHSLESFLKRCVAV
jgi:hypothetical protein